MNERYKDTDLREALRRKYSDMPQLSADFMAGMNDRLQAKPVAKTRTLWRWAAAAACLLIVVGVGMTMLPEEEKQAPVVAEKVVEQRQSEEPKVVEPEPQIVSPIAEAPKSKKQRKQQRKPVVTEQLPVQDSAPDEKVVAEIPADSEGIELKANSQMLTAGTAPKTLTERDIPITRPENYKYTPEEIALMKKQAAEAYLKWVELELEIAKHNMEQTAQQ